MTENTRARARRWPLGLLAGLCIVVAGGAHASRPVPSAALDRYIEQARRDWQVPGLAVGVIRDGEVVYARGFGVREAGKDTPVDLHTRFQIGSMSKAFTAAALGLLVDDGKLNWDDPVIDHLPWFRLSDPWLTQQVTIRDLVGHRTGISGAYIAPISNNEMVRRARYVEPIAPFRSEYLYSNLMYRVAGAVVAEVSGGTWEEFVRTRMFAPLQMNDSGASPYDFWDAAYVAPCMYCQAPAGNASFSQARVTNVAMPHRITPTGPTALPWQSIGQDGSSGALVASVTDMLMWLQMNLRNGEYHGKRFLREATLRELHATQMQPRTDYDWIKTRIEQVAGKPQYAPGYAMGWRTSQYRNLKLLDHTGALAANRAYGALLPERGMGVVILANAPGRGSGGMHEAIALRVLDLLLGAPAHDWSRDFLEVVERGERERETAEQRLQQSKLPGTRPSLPLESYGGEYQNDWFGRLRIEHRDQRLMLCLPGAFEWPLEHWHNDTFRVQVRVSGVDMLQFFVSFKLDERRQIRSLDSGWEALGKSFVPVKATLASAPYDVIVAGGDVYDGSGAPARKVDVAIKGDRIVAIGQLQGSQAARVVDARGLAVAPGFINMMSQATYSLLEDGRSQSDLRQGVTLELLGEGVTPGPLNEAMQARMRQDMSKRGVDAKWTTLGQFMKFMEQRGISTNVATTVGATSVREYVMGYADRKPTQSELENMQRLVREAMTEGAFGLSSALAYVPGSNADTDELIALASVAAEYGGIYVSHIRDEGDHLVESVEELIRIARGAKLPAEIFHLKAIGVPNWPAMGRVIERVEAARAEGVRVSANMYPYTASGTGFDVAMPPWVRQGGDDAWFARLRDPATRARLVQDMRLPSTTWSNRLINAGSPENIMILGVRNPQLEPLVGKTLGAIARQRQTSIEDTVIDLVIEDRSRLYVAYFMMSEDNLRRQIRLPWMSFGSDGESTTAAGERLKSKAHPRSYGTFARVLGHYVREEGVIALAEAVRRLSGLPASTLGLRDRGTLRVGNYADVVVFDPALVGDRATFDSPYEYARGMQSVFVNGVQVLKDGEHRGAMPGRYLRRGG